MKVEKVAENMYVFKKDQNEISMDILGGQLVDKDIKIMELEMTNYMLASQLINIEITLLERGVGNE